MFDAQLYRTKEEIESWRAKDPIARFTDWLRGAGMLHDADMTTIEAEVADEVMTAVTYAEAGSWEPIENLLRDVMTTRPAA